MEKEIKKARLCLDFTDKDSWKAIEILRKAGFKVTWTPVSGLGQLELNLGNRAYYGLDEIIEMIRE